MRLGPYRPWQQRSDWSWLSTLELAWVWEADWMMVAMIASMGCILGTNFLLRLSFLKHIKDPMFQRTGTLIA